MSNSQPDDFPQLWQKIVQALVPGGRFAGQLFGDRDSWSGNSSMTFHSQAQIESLFIPFTIEFLQEKAFFGKIALNAEKYWHVFHIVAHKN